LSTRLNGVKVVTYINACRGKEFEPMAYLDSVHIDSLPQVENYDQNYDRKNSDGPRDDLYQQIFTKIRQDENTFIHFSTVKGTVR